MDTGAPLRVGITCYPSVGGSGVLATTLGLELARRGHEVHFISYERPFRITGDEPRVHFHPVVINDYGLFKYPDYTLPLSVKMAEVSRQHRLDVLHVHYAVPHATAALLARSMLGAGPGPRVVTTLHGTDTTLLGRDTGYAPAIRHALEASDAVTAVSGWLAAETRRLLELQRPIEVIHNFYAPRPARRPPAAVRREVGLTEGEVMLLHLSNLRPVKRFDLLLDAVARIQPRRSFRLVVLAGADFTPYTDHVRRLGIADRVVVREKVQDIEDYLQAADLGLFSSESESFCLSLLEAMWFGIPSVSTGVGGIPEVAEDGVSAVLVPPGDAAALAVAVERMIASPERRRAVGAAARTRAQALFSADAIVPRYEQLYRRVCAGK